MGLIISQHFNQYAARLKQAFCIRGYNPHELQTALGKARAQDRFHIQFLSKGIPTDNFPLILMKKPVTMSNLLPLQILFPPSKPPSGKPSFPHNRQQQLRSTQLYTTR